MKIKSIKKLTATTRKGFSLVELLVVIAIIGIIAAIAIPNIAGLTGSATVGTNQRNAQNIVSTFSAARASGYTAAPTDKDDAINDVANEATPLTVGTSVFHVPISAVELEKAEPYIDSTGTGANLMLVYDKAGGN